MNIAVILSAGSGTRFGSDEPKQFYNLFGKPIIEHSLDLFQNYKKIDKIVVVARQDLVERTKDLSKKFNKCIIVVNGGARRQDSVFNALSWIQENIREVSKVLIHDAARPFIDKDLLDRLFSSVTNNDAVIPVIKSDDTLKKVNDNVVVSTLDRNEIVRVQTPQIFDFNVLFNCYNELPKDTTVTDDASVLEFFSKKVFCVEGSEKNIKVTYQDDIRS